MFRSLGERTSVRKTDRERRHRTFQSVAGSVGIPLSSSAKKPSAVSRASTQSRAVRIKLDILLVLAVVSLIIFGLLMVYSASFDYSYGYYGKHSTIFLRQLIWLALGLAGMIAMIFFDYHRFRQLAVIIMGTTVFLLLAVLFINEVINEAARALYRGSIQPSELAKFVTVVYLSVWLYTRRDQLSDMGFGLFPLAGILGLLGGLIIMQPDLSAAVTILFLGALMFFLAGGELRQIGLILVVALLIGWAIVVIFPTGADRIRYFFAGLRDPTEGSYHVKRAFEAFVNGGWFGVGLGRAETKLTGLPVPPTDSIFAVVGEETGVIGAITMIGLYLVLLWRGIKIALNAPDQMGKLMAAGLSIWICLEAFINMAVIVNLLPFAGNALPFISSGGSNLVVSLVSIGIILNISRLSVRKKEEDVKLFDAVVDLRRWNRRRRVSSPGRVASAGK